MCMYDEYESGPEFYRETEPTARKEHTCSECRRTIMPGEKYSHITGKWECWLKTYKTCAHCNEAKRLLIRHCNGYLFETVQDDLQEHIHELLPWSRNAAKYVVGMRRKWLRFDGAGLMPVLQLV